MAGTQSNVEDRVEARKQKLLTANPWAKSNPDLLRDKVFCLCSLCTMVPILTRDAVVHKGTAYSHRKVDVTKGVITTAELKAANGSKTYMPYEDFFLLYRDHCEGRVDLCGNTIDVDMEPEEQQHDQNPPDHGDCDGDHWDGQWQHPSQGANSSGHQPSQPGGAMRTFILCTVFLSEAYDRSSSQILERDLAPIMHSAIASC